MICFAESPAGFDDLVEHRLDARRAGDCTKDAADRTVLLACIFELTSEFCALGANRRHLRSFSKDGTSVQSQESSSASCELGFEGVVAKSHASLYRPNDRGWVKVKNPEYWRRDAEIEAMARKHVWRPKARA